MLNACAQQVIFCLCLCFMYGVYEYCMILESLSCTSLQEKNCLSSMKWRSLSAMEKGEYNDKAAAMDSISAEDSVKNVKQEVTKLLKRLQELVCNDIDF